MAHRGTSIATPILLVLVALTPTLLGIRVVQLYLSTRASLHTELRTAAAAEADQLAAALELPIWNIDRAEVDRVIESTLSAPAIHSVVVEVAGRRHAMTRDARGKPVAFDGNVSEAGLVREDRDIVYAKERIGVVTVYETPRLAEERLWRFIGSTGAIAGIFSVVVAVTLWVLLRRVVVLPLRQLEGYARAVTAGTRPDPFAIGARFRGEIDTLWTTLRHMVALHDVRYAQLEEAEASVRALASRLQVAREDEKTRIARDLHDDLGQLLTAAQMELRWVEQQLDAHPDADLANALTDRVVEVGRLLGQTTRSVQRIAADLRPSALDQLGLGAALRQEGRRFAERTGVPCEVVVLDDLPELDGGAAISLYRIAQEALTNVARHAQASRVTVALGANEHDLSLRIVDDGRGIGEEDLGAGSLGLLGMRERAALLGGEVRLSGGPGRGTVVEVRVPRARVVAEAAGRALA